MQKKDNGKSYPLGWVLTDRSPSAITFVKTKYEKAGSHASIPEQCPSSRVTRMISIVMIARVDRLLVESLGRFNGSDRETFNKQVYLTYAFVARCVFAQRTSSTLRKKPRLLRGLHQINPFYIT
jgi:hypothetical protein